MIIGRKNELAILREAYESSYSEFVAVCGRRRVGKTYLIREAFDYKFTFQHSGVAKGNKGKQLEEFWFSLKKYGYNSTSMPKSWSEAFFMLDDLVSKSTEERKVVFIDELPWMDTAKSGFVSALEHYWNSYASARRDVLLIICGSATSWIVNKVFRNHGGLYNRVKRRVFLKEFSLNECEQYSNMLGLDFSRKQIMDCYMVMGGVPFYWSCLKKGYSVAQNIDMLFFSKKGELYEEYSALYASLFKNPENYIKIVTELGKKRSGLTRDQLIKECSLYSCGKFTEMLEDLESSGFITRYNQPGKERNLCVYQLTDFFTQFYYSFLEERKKSDPHFWTNNLSSPAHNAWKGLSFERLCKMHIDQIKEALGISGIVSETYTWQCRKNEDGKGAQIDLLIDRMDGVVNLCEMKYYDTEVLLDEVEEHKIINRRNRFVEETKTNKSIHIVLISPFGMKKNTHSEIVTRSLNMDDLFR